MNPDQLQQYRDLLAKGKFDPDKRSELYPYQRGVNDGVAFAIDQLDKILKDGEATP